ncbi:MAG TPA: hypothetical protein VFI70_08150 [Nitrososphaeraceae archaeon]|jgi:hypothetical protein|nr:hypothetical protein [Nitrososphaeraceae archaeon]
MSFNCPRAGIKLIKYRIGIGWDDNEEWYCDHCDILTAKQELRQIIFNV